MPAATPLPRPTTKPADRDGSRGAGDDGGLGRQLRPADPEVQVCPLRLIAGLDAETLATYTRIALIANGQLNSRDTL
jgi:hypothetical protein